MGENKKEKMPSQTPRASDLPSSPHPLKFTTPRETGGADGSGQGEGDSFESNLFCSGSKLSSKGKQKKAISPPYISTVRTEATLLKDSRNSADSTSLRRSTELIIYGVSLCASLKQRHKHISFSFLIHRKSLQMLARH